MNLTRLKDNKYAEYQRGFILLWIMHLLIPIKQLWALYLKDSTKLRDLQDTKMLEARIIQASYPTSRKSSNYNYNYIIKRIELFLTKLIRPFKLPNRNNYFHIFCCVYITLSHYVTCGAHK